MQVLDGYIDHIHPQLKPNCDYVLATRNGGQHNKLGELMSKLVFDATGKYVHPTRYRQIVETVSSKQLASNGQCTISEDQKPFSVVARMHYQKQRSREVATKAHKYLEKLHGEKGTALETDVRSRLSHKSTPSPEQEGKSDASSLEDENFSSRPKLKRESSFKIPDVFTRGKMLLLFTSEEDKHLKNGIKRHGYGNWTAILKDPDFHFQEGRTMNSLLNRATRKFSAKSKSLMITDV